MSKYIRTKDNSITHTEQIIKVKDIDAYKKMYAYEEIIKQADSIEELCDVLVCIDKITGCHTLWKVIDKFDLILEDYDWYGAIWTDKGLIYVAKMNDKGNLELL